MSEPYTRLATADDCAELALTMRHADRIEVTLGGSSSPYAALLRGVAVTENPQAIIGPQGDVLAIFGVARLTPTLGSPWMLGSDGLEEIKWRFLRECKARLLELHADYPQLYNTVWEGNHLHIRWLKWLGFTVGEAPLTGPNFLPFWKNNYV